MLVGASTRDEHTKIKKLKMYIEAEQEVPEDFSFPIIGSLNRDSNNVEDAISKLNLNNDRVNASLFWFYNGNTITDEPVFDALKASKEQAKEAIDVWIKLATAEEVTKRNASAFQNLSTYYLNSAFKKATISKNNLEKGITLKLKFLESDFINNFIKLSSDETYKVYKEGLQIYFLNQVYNEIEKADATLVDWYLECISKINFTAKQNYLNNFVSKPIEVVKNLIEENKIVRKESPSKAYVLGNSLYTTGSEKIITIQNILGKSNIQFTSISDKLSDEILQCGIVYFKKFKNTDTDPSTKVMELFKKAKKLAFGSIAIQRCQENTENLQEWIDEKPERDKHNRISADLTALIEIFNRFDNRAETIENARAIVNLSKPYLSNIKNTLGASDEMYLKLSTRVASQAQSYIIEEVNNAQDNFEYKIAVDRYGTLNKIKTALRTGWEVTNLIGTLDMEYDYKTGRFNQNKNALKNLCDQLDVSTPSYSASSTGTTSKPSYASTPSSSSSPRHSYTPPKSNSDGSSWWGWIISIVIFIIVIKSCSAAYNNNYNNTINYDTAIDTSAVIVDTAAAIADTTYDNSIQNATIVDSTAISYDETQSNLKLEDINGIWYGKALQPEFNYTFTILLKIDYQNNIYECNYKSSNCKGRLVFVNDVNGNIVFNEKIYKGDCYDNLKVELNIIDNNNLKINYYDGNTNELIAEGNLTR